MYCNTSCPMLVYIEVRCHVVYYFVHGFDFDLTSSASLDHPVDGGARPPGAGRGWIPEVLPPAPPAAWPQRPLREGLTQVQGWAGSTFKMLKGTIRPDYIGLRVGWGVPLDRGSISMTCPSVLKFSKICLMWVKNHYCLKYSKLIFWILWILYFCDCSPKFIIL